MSLSFRLMLSSLIEPLSPELGVGEIIMDETGAWMLHLHGINDINGIGDRR